MSWIIANRVGEQAPKTTDLKAQKPMRVSVNMYNEMPSGEIALEEFERFAIDRLKGKLQLFGLAFMPQPTHPTGASLTLCLYNVCSATRHRRPQGQRLQA